MEMLSDVAASQVATTAADLLRRQRHHGLSQRLWMSCESPRGGGACLTCYLVFKAGQSQAKEDFLFA